MATFIYWRRWITNHDIITDYELKQWLYNIMNYNSYVPSCTTYIAHCTHAYTHVRSTMYNVRAHLKGKEPHITLTHADSPTTFSDKIFWQSSDIIYPFINWKTLNIICSIISVIKYKKKDLKLTFIKNVIKNNFTVVVYQLYHTCMICRITHRDNMFI